MNQIDKQKVLKPYIGVHLIEHENGYIVWRRGTGDNAEMLHLKTFSPGKGTGRELIKAMLRKLKENPPYATVFGFTRSVNIPAQKFYRSLGFNLSPVEGVYADGSAVIFSQLFSTLLELNDESWKYQNTGH